MKPITEEFEVIPLFEGYSKDTETGSCSNCSCTLIKGPPHIIVDTMTCWDGAKLVEALRKQDISCDDIGFVISTHGHSDHIGCNYLFQNALHVVGFSISKGDHYYNHDFTAGAEYVINDKIKVMPTPGHTLQDVSVIVQSSEGVIAITGDLFEKQEDLTDDLIWKNAGSDSEELQLTNREKILSFADYIIPGHGAMFKVKK